jgi:type I restriction-modification system DNA methylase subunit
MPHSQINQDDINKAVWAACDTFRGVISSDTYKNFILTMLFLTYISDVYKDEYNKLVETHGDNPSLSFKNQENHIKMQLNLVPLDYSLLLWRWNCMFMKLKTLFTIGTVACSSSIFCIMSN